MSSRNDPIRTLSTTRLAIDAIIATALFGLIAWALAPHPSDAARREVAETTLSTESPAAEPPFPIEAFNITLWHEPPEPVVVLPPKPPEMPNLELVGISRNGQAYNAMIYDPGTGDLLTLAAGDACGVTRILSVEADRVRCEAHGQEFLLSLGAKETGE